MADRSDELPQPCQIQTRVVRAFLFKRSAVGEAVAALTSSRLVDERPLWERAHPSAFYLDETTKPVESLLFGFSPDVDALDGAYLRVRADEEQRWFKGTVLELGSQALPLRMDPKVGIEIFLTGHGVGAVSVGFEPAADTSLASLLDFNYGVSQLVRRRTNPARIRIPHPKENPEKWARIPRAEQDQLEYELTSPVPEGSPLASRLGVRNASFSLEELTSFLVAPLNAIGADDSERSSKLHTVTRFGTEANFVQDAERFLELAAALALVQESRHAGVFGAALSIPNAMLNRHHLAACSLQGAAHLVSDQVDVPFNEERLPRARDKYFVPFLVALLQRTMLLRVASDASALVARRRHSAADISRLRHNLLELQLTAMPSEVSERTAVQQTYEMASRAFAVSAAEDRASSAIAGLEARFTAERQEEIARGQRDAAEKAAEALAAGERSHTALLWIETFIVAAYAAELINLFHEAERSGRLTWDYLLVPVAAVIAAVILRPWKGKVDTERAHVQRSEMK